MLVEKNYFDRIFNRKVKKNKKIFDQKYVKSISNKIKQETLFFKNKNPKQPDTICLQYFDIF